MQNITNLSTEKRNPNTTTIDTYTTKEILETINKEDEIITKVVKKTIDEIEKIVNYASEHILQGGRIIYIGAGTSGRLGVLDASECPPTYGVSFEMIQGKIAGGFPALLKAKEGAEDDAKLGYYDLKKLKITVHDTIIGIAASGRTPYVIGGLDYANEVGAFTGAISCVENSELSKYAKAKIEAITGPEVISGSTRMKAGTAQKLILNMISTATMIKLGKVYSNYMIDLNPSNQKLVIRAKNIIKDVVGCDETSCNQLFEESNHNVKLAICMGITGCTIEKCRKALTNSNGHLHIAIKQLHHFKTPKI